MPFVFRRVALPLLVALVLLGNAACGDAQSTAARLGDTAVDSSNPRAYRVARLVERIDTLSTLTRALRQTGLLKDLREDGPYTLFAPTDRAFQRYMPGLDSLLAPAGSTAAASGAAPSPQAGDSLRSLLQYHLVRGRFGPGSLSDSLRLGTMLRGKSLVMERRGQNQERLRIRANRTMRPALVSRSLETQNGVLHILRRPLRIPTPDTTDGGALNDTSTTASAAN